MPAAASHLRAPQSDLPEVPKRCRHRVLVLYRRFAVNGFVVVIVSGTPQASWEDADPDDSDELSDTEL